MKTDAEKIGTACLALGAGRNKKEDKIDLSAGIVLRKKKGDFVAEGEIVATLFCSEESLLQNAAEIAESAFVLSGNKPQLCPIVIEKIE